MQNYAEMQLAICRNNFYQLQHAAYSMQHA